MVGAIALSWANPLLDDLKERMWDARAQQNAQTLVETYTQGLAAGIEWNQDSRETTIRDILEGHSMQDGPFRGVYFCVAGMTNAEERAARPFIGRNEDGGLFFDPTGHQPRGEVPPKRYF